MYHTYNKHVCGMVFCKMCRDHQPQDHLCFIKPLNPKCADGGDDQMEEEVEGARHQKKKKAKRVNGGDDTMEDEEKV